MFPQFLNPNSILLQLFKTGILNSTNLNIRSVINVKKTSSLKDLINLVLNFNFNPQSNDIKNSILNLKIKSQGTINSNFIFDSSIQGIENIY